MESEENPSTRQKITSFLFKNQNTKQTVAKNTFWLSVSNFGGRLIKAVIIIYAARVLGAANYGVFSYAVTLAGFLGLFMDPGVNSVFIREITRSPESERSTIFSTAFAIKIVLLIIGVSLILFVAPAFSTLPGVQVLIPVAAFILMFDTLREFFLSLLRGMEKMEWDAAIFIVTNLAVVVLGFIFMMYHPTARALGWGYALGTGIGALVATIVVWDYVKQLFSRFSARLVAPILASAWPFAITGALGLLLTNTDILIISWMRTAADLGVYSAAIRIIQILYLIPGILQFAVLPLFSRLANKDDHKFRLALERLIGFVFLISIPLSIGGVILGTQLMSFIFGPAFAPGGMSFKILMLSMLVDFPGSIIGNAIFVYGRQKSLIITSAIGGISNVLFDLILIPRFGIAGSAIATLIAQGLSNGYLWYVMKKLNYFEILPYLKKVLGASVIMGAATALLFAAHVNVLVNIVFSTAIYFLALYIFREPLLIEIKAILRGGLADPIAQKSIS